MVRLGDLCGPHLLHILDDDEHLVSNQGKHIVRVDLLNTGHNLLGFELVAP